MKHSPEPHNWAPKKPKYLKKAQHSHAQEHAETDPKRKEIEEYLDEHCVVFWKGKITPASKLPPFDTICHWGFGEQHKDPNDDTLLGVAARMIKEYCAPYNTQDVMYEQSHSVFFPYYFDNNAGERVQEIKKTNTNAQEFLKQAHFKQPPINWDDKHARRNFGKYGHDSSYSAMMKDPTKENIKHHLFIAVLLRNEGMSKVEELSPSIDQWFSFSGSAHYFLDPARFGEKSANSAYIITKKHYNTLVEIDQKQREIMLKMAVDDFAEYKAWRKEYIREMGDPFAN